MTALPVHPLPPRAAFTNEPIFRLTVDQYHELIRAGKLKDDDPVELLEGILVFKMPKNTPHASSTKLAGREIQAVLPPGWHYQIQDPVTLSDGEPEPDGAIIRGRIEDYLKAHPGPGDIALVIEVADTSLDRDRGIKLRSYARASLPVYWIINLVDQQVEVYTEPATPPGGEPTYLHRQLYRPGDQIPLALFDRRLSPLPAATVLPTR